MIETKNIITCSGINKNYAGTQVVSNFNVSIKEAQTVALLGNNGAGKTTVLNMISGSLRPSSGSISFFNNPELTSRNPMVKSNIGIVSESTYLNEEMTVTENLLFFESLYRSKSDDNHIDLLLESFSLSQRKEQRISTLSRGWKQRVSLARSLINKPSILLLDEPEVGLDQNIRDSLPTMLSRVNPNITIILATHNLDLAKSICSRGLLMEDGKIKKDIIDFAHISNLEFNDTSGNNND
jgi:ABC-type multidrug transport system ATPase subunit